MSGPAQINTPSNPRLDPIDSKFSYSFNFWNLEDMIWISPLFSTGVEFLHYIRTKDQPTNPAQKKLSSFNFLKIKGSTVCWLYIDQCKKTSYLSAYCLQRHIYSVTIIDYLFYDNRVKLLWYLLVLFVYIGIAWKFALFVGVCWICWVHCICWSLLDLLEFAVIWTLDLVILVQLFVWFCFIYYLDIISRPIYKKGPVK